MKRSKKVKKTIQTTVPLKLSRMFKRMVNKYLSRLARIIKRGKTLFFIYCVSRSLGVRSQIKARILNAVVLSDNPIPFGRLA